MFRRDATGNNSHCGIAGRSSIRMASGFFAQQVDVFKLSAASRNFQSAVLHRVK
jgi:hypothetical protein